MGEVHGLELVLVETDEQMRIWNAMFQDEHPRGAGPLVGRQLRFLIRSSVRCQNLASRVLSLAVARMPQNFEANYGYEPWLVETFVDNSRFSGTCYRAANWTRVGSSQGRGRQDRERKKAETVKDIYVHVLAEDFRNRLGLPAHAGLGPLPLDTELEAETWAEREFGGAPLGDDRLSRRFVQSASTLAKGPMASFPGAAGGDRALLKGYYRLIDQPDESAVTMDNILLPHRQQTIRRMKAHEIVLCIQDGSKLDYNSTSQCTGLEVTGSNQTGTKSYGLPLHSTLVVTDEGLPLGVLRSQCRTPLAQDVKQPDEPPRKQKKSCNWLDGLRDCEAVAAEMPHTCVVQVMDREADFLELFDTWHQGERRTHLLVRAHHNRQTMEELDLFGGVRATEPCLRLQLHIGRKSARPKKSKQKAQAKRTERMANMALRYQRVELPPRRRDQEPIPLWIVHAVEENPPTEVEPIEWFLLTTMEVTSPEQAERLVRYYCLRWRIEDWHRVLKTGCRIEELRNTSAERLERAIAIYLVIAWHVMLMTLLGREVPDLPPEVLFSDIELEVLGAFANSRRDLKPPTRLQEAVNLVGRLGGHLGRKKDPPPGHEAIWIGYSKLRYMCEGYLLRALPP
ncbi:MAG: IS4 family transposase [Armatimonadetes bacterium]|nr:IS4 family transposase [Armatimonadota bacterium]